MQTTSYDLFVDPSVITRLIPNYVTDLKLSQDTTFPNNDGIYTNDKLFPNIQRDPIVSSVGSRVVPQITVSNVGPKVVPDTEPSVDPSETPSIDPDPHLETSLIPYNDRDHFSSDIASPNHANSISSILTSMIHRLFQFQLLLLRLYPRTSSSSSIDSSDFSSTASVKYSSFTSSVHMDKMVVSFDVADKDNDFDLSTHSVFSFKPLQALGGPT